MVVLKAFCDESEISVGAARIFTVAGGVALADRWPSLRSDWVAILKEFGLESFHFTDYENNRLGAKHDALIPALIGLVNRSGIFAPACSLVTDRTSPSALKDERARYEFCADNLFQTTWRHLDRLGLEDASVEFYFEQRDGVGNVIGAFNRGLRDDSRVGSIAVIPKGDSARELEVADLLAYEAGKSLRAQIKLDCRPLRKSLLALAIPKGGRAYDSRGGALRELSASDLGAS
ncbi:MAG TPA: hypothetical protein VL332_01670 [Candidatus Saccharimonadaceae bacterium]|nr:hypothetical protein [Candidatus Saccharimonadaceae bacterium]